MRWSRTSLAWLAISGVMYIAAVILTMMITSAEGGVLTRGGGSKPETPILSLATLVEGPAPPPNQAIWVRLVEAGQGERLLISFEYDMRPVLFTDQLRDAHACDNEARGADQQALVEEVVGDIVTPIWFKVTPRSSDTFLSCWLKPGLVRDETFTVRAVDIFSHIPENAPVFYDAEKAAVARGVPQQEAAFSGLTPAPFKLDLEWMRGARDIKFRSFDPSAGEGETWRAVMPGEILTTAWTDVYRQQLRDILLIVIGTLIGIGVTVMIEGLRPFIESLGNKSAGQKPPPSSPHSP